MFRRGGGDPGAHSLRDFISLRVVSRRAILTAIIATELIVLYLLLDGGGWVYDDNLILALAGRAGFTWQWLTSLIFQHWGIGYHFVFSGLHRLMPIDYRWALAGMLALLGGSIYLVDRIFSLLFGSRWLGLFVASFFGLSVLFIRPLQWFAGGLQALPNTFFDLLCLYGYLRFVHDGSRRWVVVAAGALAAGFMFYEKPAYLLLYLVALRWLFMSPALRPREFASTLWRERLMWGALLAVTGAWAIAYRHYGGGSGLAAGSVTLSQYLQFFRILWVQTLTPALADLTLPQSGLSAGQVLLAVALQVVAVLAVALSLHRKRSAWRAWLFLAVDVVVSGALVARARIPQFGVGIGGDLRYLLDFAWLVPLAVCFAFAPRSTVWPHSVDRRTALTVPRPLRLGVATGAVALIGYFAAAIGTGIKLQREWAGHAARLWETRVRSGLAKFETGGHRVVVADGVVPFVIVEPAFSPYNMLSRILPIYDSQAQVDGILDRPLVRIDSTGAAHRAVIGPRLGDGAMESLLHSHQVAIRGAARVMNHTHDTCVSAGSTAATVTRRLVSVASASLAPYYLSIAYRSAKAAYLPVFVDSGRGFSTAVGAYVSVARGSATSIAFLASPSPHRLMLSVHPGHTLCINRFDVVALRSVS